MKAELILTEPQMRLLLAIGARDGMEKEINNHEHRSFEMLVVHGLAERDDRFLSGHGKPRIIGRLTWEGAVAYGERTQERVAEFGEGGAA